jgi:hypothetical protein
VNRRGFFAAVVAIPGLATAKRTAINPRMLLKYRISALYGKFAEPTPEELAEDERNRRHNAEVMRRAHDTDRAQFFLAT